jgi:hypothetical protein
MTLTNLPALRSATHVAFDPFTPERLLEIGATNVVRSSDCLIIGPSRRDVLEHTLARTAWWNSSGDEEWDRLCSSEVRWESPIVLWVSASLRERVNLWRTCSWLRHLGIAYQDVLILEFDPVPPRGIPEEPLPPFDCTASVSEYPDKVLLDRLEKARPWPRARYDRAVSLWDRYVDANPLPFVQSCARGVKAFPELAPLWMLLSSFFPRRTPEGALRLSRFDELVLTILSTEWQTPVAVFVHKSEAGLELRQLLSCTGDLFLPRRLEQWVDHGSSAAVERAPGPRPPEYTMLSLVYRITERGMRLREEGLKELADAPSLPMAGTEAYSPSAPWVLLEDGQLARL